MEVILQGILIAVWDVDDVLVTRNDDQEHMSNLDEVLKQFDQQGLHEESAHSCNHQ